MHSWQKARTKYMVKKGSQHTMKPPTMMPNVLAAFVSMRNRFACTLRIRLPTPFIVLLPSVAHGDGAVFADLFVGVVVSHALSIGVLLHKNDSIFSFRFNVICIMCRIGLLLAISAPQSSVFNWLMRVTGDFGGAPLRRRSNDVASTLFDGFRWWFPVNGGETRGTLFERRPRWMRNVSRVSSNRFCLDDPEMSTW